MALKVGELFASFNLDTSGIGSAVKNAEQKLNNLGKGLMLGGAGMTAAVTVPLKNAAKAIYEAGTGFDAQMSKVFAIAGDEVTSNAAIMDELRQKALDMGSTTQFTASEAGEAFQYMAMAGWKAEDMLAGIEPIMNLAAASGEELGTVSDIVTDALTAFGLSADDASHFADVLAAASSNSNTNVAIMGESFKYVAPLAGSLGYSVDDVAVALGLMANAGIKGSMAGTSLRQVLSNLISPTEQQEAAMEALGLSLYDQNGKVKDFSELMGDMRKAASKSGFDMQKLRKQVSELDQQLEVGTITEEEYDNQIQKLTEGNGDFLKAISDLTGARGLSGFLAIMNATEEDFQKLTKAVDGSTGSAEKMKNVMLDNAKGDVTILKSALEGLEITLWGLSEGGFRSLIQRSTGLIDAFRTTDQETQKGTLRIAALAAAAGPAITGLGGFVTLLPKLAKAFTLVSGPAALLTIGLVALGAAAIDTDNSIGKTFVKGATKVGAKIRQIGSDVKKELPTLTQNMSQFLTSLSEGIAEGLPGIIDGLSDILSTGLSALAANMGNVANVSQTIVKTLAEGIRRNVPQIVPAVLDLLTNMASALISNIPVVLEGMSTVITSLVSEVNSADWGLIGAKLGTSIEESVKDTGTVLKKLAMGDKYVEDAGWDQVGSALIENLIDGMKKAAGNTRDFVGSLLLGEQYNPDEDWGTFGEKLIDRIFEKAEEGSDGITSFVTGIIEAISGMFSDANISEASDTLSALVGRIIENAAELIPNAVNNAGLILTKIGELIFGKDGEKGLAASAMEGAGTLATAIFNALLTALPSVENAAQSILTTLGEVLSPENLKKLGTSASTLAENLLKGIADAISGLGSTAATILTALGDTLFGKDENGNSLVTAGLSAITDIVKTILTTIGTDVIPKLGTTAASIITAIGDLLFGKDENGAFVGQGIGGLTGMFENIFEAVRTQVIPGLGQAIGSILTAIGDLLKPENMEQLGTGLGDLVASLFNGIADTISDAIDMLLTVGEDVDGNDMLSGLLAGLSSFGEKVFDALITAIPKVAGAGGRIIQAIASTLTGTNLEGLDTAYEGLAGNIFSGISQAFTNAVDAVKRFLAGDIEGNELGASLAQTHTGLVKTILGGISDYGNDPDVIGFVQNLGQGIIDALGEAGAVLGAFEGKLLSYLLSAEGLKDIWEAGKSIGRLILEGIKIGVKGVTNFTTRFVQELGVNLGLITRDDVNAFWDNAAAEEAAEAQAETYSKTLENYMRDLGDTPFLLNAQTMLEVVSGDNGEKWYKEREKTFAGYINDLKVAFNKESKRADFNADSFFGDWVGKVFNIDTSRLSDEAIREFSNVLSNTTARDKTQIITKFWELFFSDMTFDDPEEYTGAFESALQEAGLEIQTTVEEARQDIIDTMDASGNGFATEGMAVAIADSANPASAAALKVSDVVVQEFLMTMSAENGAQIGSTFVSGIIGSLEDGSLIAVVQTMSLNARQTLSNVLNSYASYNIGHNFGQGLVNGIRSMIDLVADAAYEMGDSAVLALQNAIREGSPSKLTAESGRMFGLGFTNSILEARQAAADAASILGAGAVGSLNGSISDLRNNIVDEMSLPGSPRQTEADNNRQESERTAQQYAEAVANALQGAMVMMDGTAVGHLVMPVISEQIAYEAGLRRPGTV